MPIYMDRHDLPGVTAKDVAMAHQEDLKIQAQFGCRGLTYWFDEERQIAFCLIEALEKDSVKRMHDQAHGLIPHQILEVESHVVEAFLGRIKDPEVFDSHDDTQLRVFNDPAVRVILSINQKKSALISAEQELENFNRYVFNHNAIVQERLKQGEGREVQYNKDGYLASFTSARKAILAAMEILKEVGLHNSKTSSKIKYQIKVGLSAGVPVTDSKDFFGKAVTLAKRLSQLSPVGHIVVSPTLVDFYKQDLIHSGYKVPVKILNNAEEKFLNRLFDEMERQLGEPQFNLVDLSKYLGVSKSQLYRKTASLTGLSPSELMKEFRFQHALNLIENQEGNISEIAYQSGFTSPSYFSKCFLARFNTLPSNYANVLAQLAI